MKFKVTAHAVGNPEPMELTVEGCPFGQRRKAAEAYRLKHLKDYTLLPGTRWVDPYTIKFEAINADQTYGAAIYVKEVP